MDAKGRLGIRKWDFSGQHASAEQVLQPASDATISQAEASQHQPTFLKISAYQGRSSAMSESNTQMTAMNFTLVPQRSFLTATKSTLGPMKPNQVNLEMTSMPNTLATAENAPSNKQFESKPSSRAGKKHSPGKKTKQVARKVLRPNQPKSQPSAPKKKKSGSASIGKREKRNVDVVAEGVTFDFSCVPTPICSCTGVARQCYRWGAGGWQSSCCTTAISEYPLPMSTSRPGSRLAGRKMSNGAYGKLLQRLAVEGCDLSSAVDLKNHWARHGTNKFVTIR